jgi:hypothetical protein
MRHAVAVALSFGGILACATNSVAYAQATRTWVSGVGDDVNPCSRTAPCKTFAGAISKTAAGGEINCLDPGGYGAVTITKSLTIDCTGQLGGVLSALAPAGVFVNGANIVVTLRHLHINGAGTGTDGVRFVNGKQLNIENTTITGVSRFGVWVPYMASAGGLVISNSTITNSVDGVVVDYGVTTVSHSIISGHSYIGLVAEGSGVLNANSNLITNNFIGMQTSPGAMLRISNNDVYGNDTGFVCAGGAMTSDGTNRSGSNTTMGCAPGGPITEQSKLPPSPKSKLPARPR